MTCRLIIFTGVKDRVDPFHVPISDFLVGQLFRHVADVPFQHRGTQQFSCISLIRQESSAEIRLVDSNMPVSIGRDDNARAPSKRHPAAVAFSELQPFPMSTHRCFKVFPRTILEKLHHATRLNAQICNGAQWPKCHKDGPSRKSKRGALPEMAILHQTHALL